ncbi:MAG: hypothetical protein PHR51_01730 [Patescibacteria group bacterium]|nr:hypothetical protein [Patescibacteria group bacterium]
MTNTLENIIAVSTGGAALIVALFSSVWLQWLRKEIDDYRGRLINLFVFGNNFSITAAFTVSQSQGENLNLPKDFWGSNLWTNFYEHLFKHLKHTNLFERSTWYNYDDSELIEHLTTLNKIPGAKFKLRDIILPVSGWQEQISYSQTYELFKKRYRSKQDIKTVSFWCILLLSTAATVSLFCMDPSFFSSLLGVITIAILYLPFVWIALLIKNF